MECEFEEKQYEQHLNAQLLNGRNLLFPPGQVLENRLGFDAALYTNDRGFWRHFPGPPFWPFRGNVRRGVKLDPMWWEELDANLDSEYIFPPFKFNVFIQHKRPQYLTSRLAKEWKAWKRAYYRYGLKEHQQKALGELGSKIGGKGIVVYASPAFHQLSALWEAVTKGTLVNQTNFAEAERLSGHSAYTYIEAGSGGKAHSECEDVESFDFKGRLRTMFAATPSAVSNRLFLIELGNIVDSILTRHRGFHRVYGEIVSASSQGIAHVDSAMGLIRVDAFCFLTQTVWMLAY